MSVMVSIFFMPLFTVLLRVYEPGVIASMHVADKVLRFAKNVAHNLTVFRAEVVCLLFFFCSPSGICIFLLATIAWPARLVFFEPDQKSTALQSRPHARVEAGYLVFKAILVLCFGLM